VLSIIVLNWNTAAATLACLQSLHEPQSLESLEVIVVDNASADGSVKAIRESWPQVHVIANSENAGYARGNNHGLRVAGGRYAVLLNSDTLVRPAMLNRLATFMDSHPEAGAVGPRLLTPDGTPQAFAFGNDPTPGYLLRRAFNRLVLRRPLHDWATNTTQEVDWVSGACILLRRSALEQVGLLDESFFMYFEDNDLCLRLRRKGWRVYYFPAAVITHFGGESLKHNPRAQAAYATSLEYFYAKHYGRLAQWWLAACLPVYQRLAILHALL
jgi:GT2 family glycosyltransferase